VGGLWKGDEYYDIDVYIAGNNNQKPHHLAPISMGTPVMGGVYICTAKMLVLAQDEAGGFNLTNVAATTAVTPLRRSQYVTRHICCSCIIA